MQNNNDALFTNSEISCMSESIADEVKERDNGLKFKALSESLKESRKQQEFVSMQSKLQAFFSNRSFEVERKKNNNR